MARRPKSKYRTPIICGLCAEEETTHRSGVCNKCIGVWKRGQEVMALEERSEAERMPVAISNWVSWHHFFARKDDVAPGKFAERQLERELLHTLIELSGAQLLSRRLTYDEKERAPRQAGVVRGETVHRHGAEPPPATAYLLEPGRVESLQRAVELVRALRYIDRKEQEREDASFLQKIAAGQVDIEKINRWHIELRKGR